MECDNNGLSEKDQYQSAKARNCQSRRIASILVIERKCILLRNIDICLEYESLGVHDLELRDFRHEFVEGIDIARGLSVEERHVVHDLEAINHLPHLAHRARHEDVHN